MSRFKSSVPWTWTWLVLALPLLAGCPDRPQAPALRDEPVYENDREGFRFLAPEGWTLQAKADVPSGRLEKERRLVSYQRLRADKGAMFEVSLADLPPSADLEAVQTEASHGVQKWRITAPPEEQTVGGVAATRLILAGRAGREELTKEVVAFRRGERVYFFTGVFAASDAKARDQVRRTVESILWK